MIGIYGSLVLSGSVAIILLSGFDDREFPSLPEVRSVSEWAEWADTTKYHEPKWLVSKREYYKNGELKSRLYVSYLPLGDTIDLRVYKLGKKSLFKKEMLLRKDRWYNTHFNKWMKGNSYYYHKGENLPYMRNNEHRYKCYYTYDNRGNITGKRLVDDQDKNFAEYEYNYDSSGLITQEIEFDFIGGRHVVSTYLFDYERNEKRQVVKKEAYFVHLQTKSIEETIYYNDKGERVKKIDYDGKGKPEFIRTYQYEYYK